MFEVRNLPIRPIYKCMCGPKLLFPGNFSASVIFYFFFKVGGALQLGSARQLGTIRYSPRLGRLILALFHTCNNFTVLPKKFDCSDKII